MDKNTFGNQIDQEADMWVLCIIFLALIEESKTEELWNSFKKEIKNGSRFFPKSEVLNIVKEISTYASIFLDKETVLYRARKYDDSTAYAKKESKELYNELVKHLPELNLTIEDLFSEAKMNIIMLKLMSDSDRYNSVQNKLKDILARNKKFWGYSKKDSDAPPCQKAPAGRANSQNISYLYATDNIDTAILEVGAKTQQPVSIAEIRILRDIKLFDFCYDTYQLQDGHYIDSINLSTLSKEFSRPNYMDALEYLPTQYLCEFIKELGFDGIRFRSSLTQNGNNIVIFDTTSANKAYEIMNSKVFLVKAVNVEFEQILPFQFNNYDKKI